jgi:hypothetical protein
MKTIFFINVPVENSSLAECNAVSGWRRGHYYPSKRRKLQWHGATFQKTWIFSKTAVRTSNVAIYQFIQTFDVTVKWNKTGQNGERVKGKGKPIPTQVPGGWGSRISRQSVHKGGKVVIPTHRPPLTPRKYSWYSFLLEAESTPEPFCGWKD